MWDKLESKLQRFEELERQMADPDIASDHARYNAIAREHGAVSKVALKYRAFKDLDTQFKESQELLDDPDMHDVAAEEVARLQPLRTAAKEELADLILSGPQADHDSIIVEIRAGTGGDEASLFARDLYEMYRRYAEGRGWKTEIMDFSVSEQRGFKEVVFGITGADAYRDLQFESGGHRVQRVPETETQGRIHTSAATVAVLAEPEAVEIEIRPEDIDMQFTRSSGPGGQHVNKTSSAVRLTHLPTGVAVFCQEERSQHKNRDKAMRMLRSRLFDQKQREQRNQRDQMRRTLIGSGDRSERIRTYNFPQNRCTDHRINQSFNVDAIMAGGLDKLIKALRDFDREQQLGASINDL